MQRPTVLEFRRLAAKLLDVPIELVDAFYDRGVYWLTIHLESDRHMLAGLTNLRSVVAAHGEVKTLRSQLLGPLETDEDDDVSPNETAWEQSIRDLEGEIRPDWYM